jgi:hypothetical protein
MNYSTELLLKCGVLCREAKSNATDAEKRSAFRVVITLVTLPAITTFAKVVSLIQTITSKDL